MIFRTTYFRLSSLLKQESQGLTNITLQVYFNEQNHTFPTLFTSNYDTIHSKQLTSSKEFQYTEELQSTGSFTKYPIRDSSVPGARIVPLSVPSL